MRDDGAVRRNAADGITVQERKEKREQERKARLDEKIALAKQPETKVVYNRTLDARYMSQFINSLDFLMDRARKNLGLNSRLGFDVFQRLLEISNSIMFLINLFCAKTSRIIVSRYVPPRGHLDLSKGASAARAVEELEKIISILQQERDVLAREAADFAAETGRAGESVPSTDEPSAA